MWTDSRRKNSKKELIIINNEKGVLLSRKMKNLFKMPIKAKRVYIFFKTTKMIKMLYIFGMTI